MKGYLKRDDDFQTRREHLAELGDEALEARFWALLEETVEPLLAMAKTHTTPSVERSVLLRMGFSSVEAKPLVTMAMGRGLMGKGVGHIVYRAAMNNDMTIREAGLALLEERLWDTLDF